LTIFFIFNLFLFLICSGGLGSGAAAGQRVPAKEQNQGTYDGDRDRAQVHAGHIISAGDQTKDEPADDRAHDAEDHSGECATPVSAGVD